MEIQTGAATQTTGSEIRLAYLIAFFAAILSVIDIGAGKYRDREILSVNRKMTAYGLYHTTMLKETLIQGERDLLEDLFKAGAIAPKDTMVIRHRLKKFEQQVSIITNEKQEIALGSASLDSTKWSMSDLRGRKGMVKGIQQWEQEVTTLDLAGDQFDLACLLLELSLVLGAIGFLTKSAHSRNLFLWLMIIFGAIGSGFGLLGYFQALSL